MSAPVLRLVQDWRYGASRIAPQDAKDYCGHREGFEFKQRITHVERNNGRTRKTL